VVLVVEDDVLVRMIATDILEEAGLRTAEARDAKEAMILLEARPEIRVLFTDWNMPGEIDGLGLARMVYKRWPAVGMIVTSGKMDPEPGELPAGARFLKKPYRPSALIQEVEDLLDDTEVELGAPVIPEGLLSHSPSSHAAGGGDIAGPPSEPDKT
jgi:CheY-like chemotaxis protein